MRMVSMFPTAGSEPMLVSVSFPSIMLASSPAIRGPVTASHVTLG